MGKIAFVFSGQGAQYTGMGQELYEKVPASAKVFGMFDAIREGTSAQCFTGTEDELSITINTQPCLFAVESAAAAALTDAGIKADMAAGFSLGELSALCYAGAAGPDEMFRLVIKRAECMQEASEKVSASMAAALKLSPEKVEEICSRFKAVYPVNYNCPGQISVSGLAGEMPVFMQAVKAEGGRAVPLKVKAGFHSPFMAGAAEKFTKVLSGTEFKEPRLPVYANFNALPYPSGDQDALRETLGVQICSPVRWENTVRNMINDGADVFIEIGPGNTLSGMIKRISSDVRIYQVSDTSGIEKIKAEI